MSSKPDLVALRESGAISLVALQAARDTVAPGITTLDIDHVVEQAIRQAGGVPAFLGFNGFTASACTSINDELVHGIPTKDRVLAEGDIISIDVGTKVRGWYSDTAITLPVGTISREAQNLLAVTQQSLEVGLEEIVVGKTVGHWGEVVQKYVEKAGMGVVRECVGHGVGTELHGEPSIPNYGKRGRGATWEVGMVVAVEPMVTLGDPSLTLSSDKWTLATRDGSLAAHFEETVAITADGLERLTPLGRVLQPEIEPGRVG